LGYQFLEKLVEGNRVKSMLFFTGTPHRGKNFGFISLLKLLRPDLFDPKQPLGQQLLHLREVMIRNNKQNVTDLRGNRLFRPPAVTNLEFQFSPEEREFYEMLTEFIMPPRSTRPAARPSNSFSSQCRSWRQARWRPSAAHFEEDWRESRKGGASWTNSKLDEKREFVDSKNAKS
jgi:hypothetical protein